jgi:ATP-dependent helicase/nuclease subunit A
MSIADAGARTTALDPMRSFCVSAPAGSGKTELLIQRFLALLSRVNRPEQVVAITFTRKAAAEMRERLVEALQAAQRQDPCDSQHALVTRALAEQALQADANGQWHLVRDINRINIKTIDSFCGGLTRQMPVLSEFGGQAGIVDDASELYREAVMALFEQLDGSHPVAADLSALLLHFDNNWDKLLSLLSTMLARRDQWRDYVGVHHAPEKSEAYLLQTVESLVCEELSALSSHFVPYGAQLLDLQQFAAGNLSSSAPQLFPAAQPQDLPAWRALRNLLLTAGGTWRKRLDKTIGFPADKGEPQQRKAQLQAIIGELQQVEGLEEALAAITFLPLIEQRSASWQLVLHLSHVLPMLAAQLLLVFQKHGMVDHSQVALSALQALGEDDTPTELALRLDYQIEHILVDEFQDTAINQFELLRRLTRGWGEHNAGNPQHPRTILIVGDGMQSIYGFRDANVSLFLQAREEGFNGVVLDHLELVSNFRSDEGIVEWINETFVWAFPAQDNIARGQVSFTGARSVRGEGVTPAVTTHGFHGDSALAQEIVFIREQIELALRDENLNSIAILGRNRNHLQPVISALKAAGISYAAQDMDSLASSPVAADLLTLCRALANTADRPAWMALLRAPWCALELADLLLVGAWGESPRDTPVLVALQDEQLRQQLSAVGQRAVARFLSVLTSALRQRDRLALRVWIEQTWVSLHGPATALECRQLQDAESFLQLLEQAEREGLGLDVDWLGLQLQKRYVSATDPESRVQLMTLHKAKGLEFDHVIIPQLARPPRSDGRQLLLWDEFSSADGCRGFLLAADDHSEAGAPTLYNYLHRQRQQKSLLEGTRLLYVGATRAIQRLQLTASLIWDDKKEEFRAPSSRSLLSPIWPTFRQQMTICEPALGERVQVAVPQQRVLRRLTSLPEVQVAAAVTIDQVDIDPNIPSRPGNAIDRAVGTVVHLAMEELSCRSTLPSQALETDLQRWRLALSRLGLWGGPLDMAAAAVTESINTCLADTHGRWILDAAHPEAHSEWQLTCLSMEGRSRDLVIDRSFLDSSSGVRWLVDYKNSRPGEGETLANFLAREEGSYSEQLLGYRNALRDYSPTALRCALYFTALGHLHHIEDLDLGIPKE